MNNTKIHEFLLPIRKNNFYISQGFNGKYSHNLKITNGGHINDDRYSVDFAVDVGEDVFATKFGKVKLIVNESTQCYRGLDPKEGMRIKYLPNLIVIEHENGIHTLYSHLMKGSIKVKKGNFVNEGQIIGKTGLSGWIGPLPHLHFSAMKFINGLERRSLKFQFENYNSPLEDELLRKQITSNSFED